MGKSSLMTRTAVRLRSDGHAVAILDLTEFGKELTQEQWYYGMLRKLGREIGLFEPLVKFWKQNLTLGPLNRLMEALREVALCGDTQQAEVSDGSEVCWRDGYNIRGYLRRTRRRRGQGAMNRII